MFLVCLPQREDEAFSGTAASGGHRLLRFCSASPGSEAANEWLGLRGFLPLPSFSWVHPLFSQPKDGKKNNLWDRDDSWLVMATDSSPSLFYKKKSSSYGMLSSLKVGKEAMKPFLFIYLLRGCKSLGGGKVMINQGDFPPSRFFQPPPPSFTYLAGG